jgi:hypothetical protein
MQRERALGDFVYIRLQPPVGHFIGFAVMCPPIYYFEERRSVSAQLVRCQCNERTADLQALCLETW